MESPVCQGAQRRPRRCVGPARPGHARRRRHAGLVERHPGDDAGAVDCNCVRGAGGRGGRSVAAACLGALACTAAQGPAADAGGIAAATAVRNIACKRRPARRSCAAARFSAAAGRPAHATGLPACLAGAGFRRTGPPFHRERAAAVSPDVFQRRPGLGLGPRIFPGQWTVGPDE